MDGPAASSGSPPDALPERLAHFRITGRLGQGGMGTVYRAVDERLHRDVAIKLLAGGLEESDDRRKRFEREARAIAALSHPNIVTVYSVDQIEGRAFLVMELIEGRTLADAIPPSGMELEQLLEIAAPLVSAVAVAHEQGIVHRDLKPQNVMIGEDGQIKVLDFGLAKLTEEPLGSDSQQSSPTMTVEGRILGTPSYMSPEQAEGRPVDARSDVFSLGVILYELALGDRPFKGATNLSVITSLLRDEAALLHERRPGLPPQLSRIARRCLMKDPKQRYQSARDLYNDLEELRTERNSTGVPVALPSQRTERRRVAIVGVAGALVVFLGFAAYRLGAAAPRAGPSAAPATSSEAAPRFTKLTRMTSSYALKGTARIAPDGKWFVYSSKSAGHWDVYRQRIGGANATNLTAGSGVDNTEPAISPDGESVAFRSERGDTGVFVMGATGESARRVSDVGHDPAWSHDGMQLAVSTVHVEAPLSRTARGELWAIDVATGAKRRIETGEDSTLPSFSPDGRFVAYHYWDGFLERGIAVIEASGRGKPAHLFRGLATWAPSWSPDGRYVYASAARAGSTNVLRVPFDAAALRFGEPESVTNGVGFDLFDPSISQDGKKMLFTATHTTSNLERVRFDVAGMKTVGPVFPLTRGTNRFGDIEVSPDGSSVVFASGWYGRLATTQEDLFVARSDGSDIRKLTDDAPYDRAPRWTNDGKRIVFYSQRGDASDAGWTVSRDSIRAWSIGADGSGLTLLLGAPGDRVVAPSPSPLDSRASALLSDRFVLFDMNKPPGEAVIAEFPRVDADEIFYPCSWTRDGAVIYGQGTSVRSDDVTKTYAFSVATRTYRKVGPASDWVVPVSDGKHLVYTWDDELRTLDLHDASSRVLLDPSPDHVGDFAFSRDEAWLYFSLASVDGDVWLAEPE